MDAHDNNDGEVQFVDPDYKFTHLTGTLILTLDGGGSHTHYRVNETTAGELHAEWVNLFASHPTSRAVIQYGAGHDGREAGSGFFDLEGYEDDALVGADTVLAYIANINAAFGRGAEFYA